ncbi:MAG TPA: hypothetical protein VG405_09305 [Solirubrobacteraceae bacterium]|jgi:hypothetical protein|nr:hypothetical protein [Solirubrobacteraceae bacterium]
MSTGQPSEEELRAAYEEQIKQVRVEHVLLDNVVMMINLGMRRTGLMPGTEAERDVGQVQLAIESVRALMPMLEAAAPEQGKQIREALSQLQMAYVQLGGQAPPGEGAGSPVSGAAASETGPAASGDPSGAPGPGEPGQPGDPGRPAEGEKPGEPGQAGPAQRSGRLWIPGQ